MQKPAGDVERGAFSFALTTIFKPGTGYKRLSSSVYVFATESHLPLDAQRPLMHRLPFLTFFQRTGSGGKQTNVTAYFARHLVPVGPGRIDYTIRISGSEYEY